MSGDAPLDFVTMTEEIYVLLLSALPGPPHVIVCWNCFYMNQSLLRAPAAERQAVADAIAASSPVCWQHVTLHGEFAFSNDV